MATIRIHGSDEVIEDQVKVAEFLNSNEVIYEQWDISKLPADLSENFQLSDEQKNAVLQAFDAEIKNISERRGYQTADVIALSDATPNLDQLLTNFQKEHHHTDDEVRFIVSGHGIFIIQGKDEVFFDVRLEPGDLISVPENVRHFFTLQEDRKVVAVRIFVTPEGWVPIYEQDEVNA
jgi:1,2-dihydroxy-3-keto-5-methylthiopentene dioxygenase